MQQYPGQNILVTKYPGENSPPAKTIMDNVEKFQKAGSFNNLPHVVTKVNKRVGLAKNS